MKKIILVFLIFASLDINAQVNADGTVIQGFSATDINNNFFSSTVATNNGKHILIDFSATWCGFCWNYHNTKVLDKYNDKYGPNGTDAKDAEVMLYEADASTDNNALNGIGSGTVGDWVMSTSYRIYNESNVTPVKTIFSSNGVIPYPSVFLITADKKMYKVPTTITDEVQLRDFVNQKAGLTPLSTNEIDILNIEYSLYPNPASNSLTVALNLKHTTDIKLNILNAMGQNVYNIKKQNQTLGETKLQINTTELANGIYFAKLTIGEKRFAKKFIIQK